MKPPYPILKKKIKKETEVGKFKKFMDILTKLKVNIPSCEALEKIMLYEKYMKDLLIGKCKLKYNENIAL